MDLTKDFRGQASESLEIMDWGYLPVCQQEPSWNQSCLFERHRQAVFLDVLECTKMTPDDAVASFSKRLEAVLRPLSMFRCRRPLGELKEKEQT